MIIICSLWISCQAHSTCHSPTLSLTHQCLLGLTNLYLISMCKSVPPHPQMVPDCCPNTKNETLCCHVGGEPCQCRSCDVPIKDVMLRGVNMVGGIGLFFSFTEVGVGLLWVWVCACVFVPRGWGGLGGVESNESGRCGSSRGSGNGWKRWCELSIGSLRWALQLRFCEVHERVWVVAESSMCGGSRLSLLVSVSWQEKIFRVCLLLKWISYLLRLLFTAYTASLCRARV